MQDYGIFFKEKRLIFFGERTPENINEQEKQKVLDVLKTQEDKKITVAFQTSATAVRTLFRDCTDNALRTVAEDFAFSGRSYGNMSAESIVGILEVALLAKDEKITLNCPRCLNAFRIAWGGNMKVFDDVDMVNVKSKMVPRMTILLQKREDGLQDRSESHK